MVRKKDLLLLRIIDEILDIGYYKGAKFNGKNRYVDFNQGVDPRLLTKEKVKKLSKLALKPLRIAFDHIELSKEYIKKIEWVVEYGFKSLSNYILFNFEKKDDLNSPSALPFDITLLNNYVQDFADLLQKGSIAEQKSFLRSFIKRITVNHPNIEIEYTIPLIKKKAEHHKNEVLPLLQSGSPLWLINRTFSITICLESTPNKKDKPRKIYRNPVCLAKEYADMIKNCEAKSEADLARKLGISRARVNQILKLLKLDSKIMKSVEKLGDPLTSRVVTERMLRQYIDCPNIGNLIYPWSLTSK